MPLVLLELMRLIIHMWKQHTVLPECALINCMLLCLKHFYQQTIVLLSALKQHVFQHVFQHIDVFMSLIGRLNPERFT